MANIEKIKTNAEKKANDNYSFSFIYRVEIESNRTDILSP